MKYILKVKDIELFSHLGVDDDEINFRQKIHISYMIYNNILPDACVSDNINDADCYGFLYNKITNFVKNNKVKLIEHLTYKIYKIIKRYTNKNIRITVCKVPPIKNIKEASFTIDDE